jgi:GT2 family glycosyltransferase
MTELSIVIPSWNGKHFLERCFTSIQHQTLPSKKVQVVLVDNGSTDGTIGYCKQHFPWVTLVALAHNTGFDGAVNAGIAASSSPLIFLLNNDTELDEACLAQLISAAERHPEAGFFATKMLDFTDRTIIDSCGDALCWNGKSYNRGQLQTDGPEFSTEQPVFGACAGAALYRSAMLTKIGEFDEDFFAYLEDVDISFRAQAAGYPCIFVPTARVYHIGSATAGKGSAFGFKLFIKNHFHLIWKNYRTSELIRHAGKLLYAEARIMAAAIRQQYFGAYLWGLGHAILEAPRMLPKRRKILSLRTVSDEYLNSVIDATFTYQPVRAALHRK